MAVAHQHVVAGAAGHILDVDQVIGADARTIGRACRGSLQIDGDRSCAAEISHGIAAGADQGFKAGTHLQIGGSSAGDHKVGAAAADQKVRAGAAIKRIVTIAARQSRLADGAGAAIEDIGAKTAKKTVHAAAGNEGIVTTAADQGIAARAGIDQEVVAAGSDQSIAGAASQNIQDPAAAATDQGVATCAAGIKGVVAGGGRIGREIADQQIAGAIGVKGVVSSAANQGASPRRGLQNVAEGGAVQILDVQQPIAATAVAGGSRQQIGGNSAADVVEIDPVVAALTIDEIGAPAAMEGVGCGIADQGVVADRAPDVLEVLQGLRTSRPIAFMVGQIDGHAAGEGGRLIADLVHPAGAIQAQHRGRGDNGIVIGASDHRLEVHQGVGLVIRPQSRSCRHVDGHGAGGVGIA